eukprot:TRINITY_DN2204_c0_g1_i2.p1 TRINITY_DN2204_c0_g1~~TRINITY_DN2204_c0_g1_i2.p1  ORF type:complete len:110 (+),score=12.09 TRINITY_DN2204_c0_g1_i2:434-763(+)
MGRTSLTGSSRHCLKNITRLSRAAPCFAVRNPKYFGMILDFMRSGQIDLEELGQKDLRQLRDDADFYQLDALAAILETVHHEEKDRNAAAERAGVASNIAAIDSILEKM